MTMSVQGVDPKFPPARYTASQFGNAETSLPIFDQLFVQNSHVWIHKHGQRDVAAWSMAFDYGNRQGLVYLGRSQTDASVLDHRLHHVVDESLNRGSSQS